MEQVKGIGSVAELLAHGRVLENEAARMYEEIADAMEVHNNQEVAELFRRLQGYANRHAAEIEREAEGMELPHIPPWDFKWGGSASPESAAHLDAHYLMTPYHALSIAHRAEMQARDFYAGQAVATPCPDVRALAARFAEEESGHVALLEEWMGRLPEPEDDWDYDPDPPGVPE